MEGRRPDPKVWTCYPCRWSRRTAETALPVYSFPLFDQRFAIFFGSRGFGPSFGDYFDNDSSHFGGGLLGENFSLGPLRIPL